MPNLASARSRLSVCEFSHFLYICGDGSDLIEAYDVRTGLFDTVEVKLPEDSACCLVRDKQELVVISGKYATRWRAGEGCQLVQITKSKHPKCEVSSNSTPLLMADNGLIYLSWAGCCYSLKVDGTDRRQVAIAN